MKHCVDLPCKLAARSLVSVDILCEYIVHIRDRIVLAIIFLLICTNKQIKKGLLHEKNLFEEVSVYVLF